ncbi:alpha,alpha-trehalose-phosphate synthase (UDP-forming) [Candidatus Deferrimicrobium sp.]|uniref:alpha,alpha-trehalose-phosphate synthase (UDP-forming) n=1 Tax=Candidatus Deferrimicrobium sp. TaxID=3060586 RepID=UPI003C44864C
MKITLRLVVSLVLVVALVAFAFSFYQVQEEKIRLTSDLERRTIVLAESLQESVTPLVTSDSPEKLNRFVQRFGNRDRFQGIAVHDARGQLLASTADLEPQIPGSVPQIVHVLSEGRPADSFVHVGNRRIYLYAFPLASGGETIGVLTLFYNASYIDVRLEEIWGHNLIRFLVLFVLVVAITLIVVRWSITGPIAQVAVWMRDLRTGKTRTVKPADLPKMDPALDPLISEASRMAKSLAIARARAEKASSLLARTEPPWTADRLREHMRAELGGKKLHLVSNREPYLHEKDGPGIRCIVPAGGLVTALDPVMRVCDGLWIAHGSGDADRETVDGNDKLRVPPGEPAYTLKRVWLTREEEDGYYYGFSNEGLWPLCHITHIRPEFRLEDWTHYRKVNEKFADALLEEIAGEESPLVLVQDYHLALLPALIKEKRPDAKVAIFWHIPWPNPEAYGICPWRQEILQGMLGSDIIGFHIQFHCNNFLETVDRFLESKIEWEHFSVTRGGHSTLIKPFPISVSFELPSGAPASESWPTKEDLLRMLGVEVEYLGVGVDRIDYTKGIPERFRAIERFFEKYPEYLGRFTFVELGAPSRTHIKKYRDLMTEIEEAVEKINWRFQTKTWRPIVFLKAHHTHETIGPYYKASDLCMVTSLHDGMNLVAKEFVAARDDDDGVLILSQFTGASRELKDAVIVNPYDIEQMADAIRLSLGMPPAERCARMGRMRETLVEFNIYRWAGKLIAELARLRLADGTSTSGATP